MDKTEDLRPATTQYQSVAPPVEPAAIEAAPPSSTLQRTIHALRKAVPLVQRLLPILDGNIAATVVNVLASQAVAPAPPVNLVPVEESISKLRAQNSQLRDQIDDQNLALKRLELRLDAVREAADRSALEQQQILGSLKRSGRNLKIFAFSGLALLILSVLLNLALLLHLERALR
jgi:hypothetical protein